MGHWDYVDFGYRRAAAGAGIDEGRERLRHMGLINPEVLPDRHFGGDSSWKDFADLERQVSQVTRYAKTVRCVKYTVSTGCSEGRSSSLPVELTERPYDVILFNFIQDPGVWALCHKMLRSGGYLVTRINTFAVAGMHSYEADGGLDLFEPLVPKRADTRFSLFQKRG